MNDVARERAQSFLKPEHQQRILDAYHAFADDPGFARVATVEQIAGQQFSLSIPLYVKRTLAGNGQNAAKRASLPELWAAWEQNGRAFWQEMDELVVMLDGLVDEG